LSHEDRMQASESDYKSSITYGQAN